MNSAAEKSKGSLSFRPALMVAATMDMDGTVYGYSWQRSNSIQTVLLRRASTVQTCQQLIKEKQQKPSWSVLRVNPNSMALFVATKTGNLRAGKMAEHLQDRHED